MRYKFWLGLVLSAALVLFVFYQVDIRQLTAALRSVQFPLLILAVFALLFTLVIKAWRWHYLIESIKSVGVFYLWSATSIGAMTDMVFPARTGDLVRAYMVGQKEQVSKMASLATLVVEKVMDILIILLISAPLLAFVALPEEDRFLSGNFRIGIYIGALLCLGIVGGLFFIRSKSIRSARWVHTYLPFLPKRWQQHITEVVDNFVLGLQTIKTGRHLVLTLLFSVVLWVTHAFSNYLILTSFSLHMPVYAAFLFLVFQVFGVTLPSSPGFIGTYHAAVVVGFSLFGVSQEMALSVAIMMHAAFFFPFILLGLLFLWRENMSFRTLWTVDAKDA